MAYDMYGKRGILYEEYGIRRWVERKAKTKREI